MLLLLPGSLGSARKAKRGARQFSEVLSRILNCSIAHAPLAVSLVSENPFCACIGHLGPDKLPVAFPLNNGHYFFVEHHVCLRRSERYLTTLEYRYTYQLERDNDESWLIRWEYQREPVQDYPYPRFHVHVNGCPSAYRGNKPFPDLHIPSGRVTLEDIARHLILEHQIKPITPKWDVTFGETEAAFWEIQRKRFA